MLIAPLVIFIPPPKDPRLVNTMDRVLLPPEKGGLTSTGLLYRYDTQLFDDDRRFLTKGLRFELSGCLGFRQLKCNTLGVGGREGAFSMCISWLSGANTRASVYDSEYLPRGHQHF